MDATKVTRIEYIDHTKDLEEGGGRTVLRDYTEPKPKVELQLQDDGKTLKIFVA